MLKTIVGIGVGIGVLVVLNDFFLALVSMVGTMLIGYILEGDETDDYVDWRE